MIVEIGDAEEPFEDDKKVGSRSSKHNNFICVKLIRHKTFANKLSMKITLLSCSDSAVILSISVHHCFW